MAGRPNDKLTEEVRTFVVQSLAMFDTPSAVAASVKAEFKVTVSRQAVEAYDPTKRAGASLAARWKALFEETRATFLDDASKVATTHRLVRVRRLEKLYERAESAGNTVEARNCLRQIAEEMGDAYTNTRVLRGGLELTTPKTLADFYGSPNA